MRNADFLAGVQRIAQSNPTYREGGSGKDGTCDCVGLIMGALGGTFPLHSSNYFARVQMRMLDALVDESQLHEGSIVYKGRRNTGQLNERYQEGGRYYNGDLLDYYHVGVVTSIEPLEINHCTSANGVDGIARDSSIRGWTHFGDLLMVDYEAEEEVPIVAMYTAIVTAPSGKTVNMRKRPDKEAEVLKKVPVGAEVDVLESASGWCKIRHENLIGYMMAEFVQKAAENTGETEGQTVTLTISKATAEGLYKALQTAMEMR